jgi:hypothetical protein
MASLAAADREKQLLITELDKKIRDPSLAIK